MFNNFFNFQGINTSCTYYENWVREIYDFWKIFSKNLTFIFFITTLSQKLNFPYVENILKKSQNSIFEKDFQDLFMLDGLHTPEHTEVLLLNPNIKNGNLYSGPIRRMNPFYFICINIQPGRRIPLFNRCAIGGCFKCQ